MSSKCAGRGLHGGQLLVHGAAGLAQVGAPLRLHARAAGLQLPRCQQGHQFRHVCYTLSHLATRLRRERASERERASLYATLVRTSQDGLGRGLKAQGLASFDVL